MQELKKTAFFAAIGAVVFTLANLAIGHNALLHESQYLLSVKGDTHTQREYIDYKSRY